MKPKRIEDDVLETAGYYNKAAGELVTICRPQSQQPHALFRIPLSEIPSDLREVVKNDGIRLLATTDVTYTPVEQEVILTFSNIRLALDS
jgi:hypothetical protein